MEHSESFFYFNVLMGIYLTFGSKHFMAAQWKLGAAMWKTNERTSYLLCDILLSIVDNLSSKVGKICVLNPPWFDIKAIKTIKIILKLVKNFLMFLQQVRCWQCVNSGHSNATGAIH